MSSRRYQEDIRRIVGMPDVAGGLDDDLQRMRIDGARGIYLIGADSTQTGDTPGTDADGNDKDPITPPEGDGNTNDDGSGQGDGNTDADATNPDDFIDNQDESNWTVGDDLFGGNWGAVGGTTFSDCVDGTCIEIVDGDKGYIPPEGWDSADLGPIDPDWQSGTYWAVQNTWYGATAGSACAAAGYGGTGSLGSFRFCVTTDPPTRGPDVVGPSPCSAAIPYCNASNNNEDPVRDEFWPSDDCIQLSKNADGQWAASPRESPSDMTAKYSEAKSSLDLCTPSGDGVQILPGADGGTVYWNYTTGIFRAVSPDGKQSFGGSSSVTQAVAGSVAGGADGPKAVGSPVPSG